MEKTKQLLREKALTEESVLGNTTKIMNLARECNVTLRWLILHTTPPASGMFIYLFVVLSILAFSITHLNW